MEQVAPGLQKFQDWMCYVHSRSVVSDSLRPCGLQPTRLLCPWGFSRQEYWSGLLCPPLGDLPSPGIEPSSALQADSLPSESPGNIRIGYSPFFSFLHFGLQILPFRKGAYLSEQEQSRHTESLFPSQDLTRILSKSNSLSFNLFFHEDRLVLIPAVTTFVDN